MDNITHSKSINTNYMYKQYVAYISSNKPW